MSICPSKALIFCITGSHEEQRYAILLFLKNTPYVSLFVDCMQRISKSLAIPTNLPWVLHIGYRDIDTILSILQEVQHTVTLKYIVIDPINALSHEHQALFISNIRFLYPHLVFFFLFEHEPDVLMYDVQTISQHQIMEVLTT